MDDHVIQEFLDAARAIWLAYRQHGPGGVPESLLRPLSATHKSLALSSYNQTVQDAVQDILDLSNRCVQHPQGLCFVTGEHGLIPRKDLHERMESALQELATH